MSTFVEVQSVDKSCQVIINLDSVVEIAPLAAGGCEVYFNDGAAVNGVRVMKVKDSYTLFQQFALQTVSAEDINTRFGQKKIVGNGKTQTVVAEIPKL